jgi:GT2 family glycosyltransferase
MYNKNWEDGGSSIDWFKGAKWFSKGLKSKPGAAPSSNGSIIDFVAGGFMALGMDAIRQGDIPDKRLYHNGGDIVVGEQVNQAGFKIKMFNKGKIFVHSSGHERRGFHEAFQWDPKRSQSG